MKNIEYGTWNYELVNSNCFEFNEYLNTDEENICRLKKPQTGILDYEVIFLVLVTI